MSYYKDKVTALRMIDSMINEGKTEQEIIFKIQTMFGFSSKIVKDRINLLRDLKNE